MGSMMKRILYLLPVIIGISLVYYPHFWVAVMVLIDFYTPWVAFESPLFAAYHSFLVSRLPERPEIPLPEITAEEATPEYVRKMSKDFTFPIVIRGLLGNTTGVQNWGNHQWWIDNYGDEDLLCGTLSEVVEDCTVRGFFQAMAEGKAFYVSGASEIFNKHKELHDMIDNEAIRRIEPGTRTATQVFMGLPEMGSDIHSAIGINIFRMVTGRKKWWFVPPDQTPYLMPSINVNGFSSHTMTKVGKMGEEPSPWFSKLVRYTTTLNPGDCLINPPWFWHGILNLGDKAKNELVIGSPTRYGGGSAKIAVKVNPMYSINAYLMFYRRYGNAFLQPGFKPNLQQDIANNRRDREKKPLKEVDTSQEAMHPFDEED